MKDVLQHIESLKAAFAKLQPLSTENQQRLDKKFRLEWNYNSNHIEGNTLTYSETELLLIFGETKGNHEFREYEEMKGHDVALKLIEDLAFDKERDLSENFIRELNKAILKEPFYKEAITPDGQSTRRLIEIGKYKSFPNSVRLQNGEIFSYASPAETPAAMNDLMNWYNETVKNKTLHPVEIAAELHYKFVCIHPFDDGNGRISRLLMNYHLLKNGYPPVIIKSSDKKNYLFALHEADTGNLEAFKKYIAEQLIWSYEISIKAAKGESVDEKGDWEKKIEILRKETSKKNILNSKKNIDSIEKIIENSFIPLIKNLFSKLKPLEEFYLDSNFYIEIDENRPIVSKDFSKILNTDFFVKEDLHTIFYSYRLNNFSKNGINTFNSRYTIIFKFSDTSYYISYKNITVMDIEKDYTDYLIKEELEAIESYIADAIYKQIQDNIKQAPLN